MESSLLPDRPEEPLPSECCGSGCEPCVLDVYQDQLDTWKTLHSMTLEQRAKWWAEKEKRDQETLSTVGLPPAFSHTEYRSFTLTEMTQLTPDTILYTFALQPGRMLGLTVGQHILLRVEEADKQYLVRQYTPVSPLDHTDSFQIAIKLYADGQMSQHIKQWVVGSTALWRGPFGKLSYSPNKYSHIGLLACGTGIAPMIQVIRAILENEEEDTFIRLVYACRTQHDIMLKRELLDDWTSHWNFSVLYALSKASQESVATDPGSIRYGDRVQFGRVDGEVVKSEMPPPGSGRSFVMLCGTKSFTSDMTSHLAQNGYSSNMIHMF